MKTYNDEKGWGFIELEEGLDVWFHKSHVRRGIKPLEQVQVIFDCQENPKHPGKFMAVNISIPRYGGKIKRFGPKGYGYDII